MKIKELRQKHGIKQTELAEMLGVSHACLSFWESGKRKPPIKHLLKMADIFHVTTDYILGCSLKTTYELTEEEAELIELTNQLTEEEIQELSKFIDFIISKRK